MNLIVDGISDVIEISQGDRSFTRGGRSVNISASRISGCAPCGVLFDTEVVWPGVDSVRNDLLYTWEFDTTNVDLAPDAYDYVDRISKIGTWNRRKSAQGPNTAFTFREPGTYTVRLTVTDGILVMQSEVQITAEDPNVVYANDTAVVSPAGNFAGAPAGATQFSTFKAAVAAWKSSGRRGRILLARGETHDGDVSISDADRCYIGAFGDGLMPVVFAENVAGPAAIIKVGGEEDAGDVTVTNLRLEGSWDPVNLTGDPGTDAIKIRSKKGTITLDTLEFSGNHQAVNLTMHYDPKHTGLDIVTSNVDVRDWRFYGIYYKFARKAAVIGAYIEQHVDADGNGQYKTGERVDHNAFRCPGLNSDDGGHLVLDVFQSFGNAGWSPGHAPDSPTGSRPAHNTLIRLNTDSRHGMRANLSRILMEGGYSMINVADAGADRGDLPSGIGAYVDVLIDKAFLLGTANTNAIFAIGHAGICVRNTLGIIPTPPEEIGTSGSFISRRNELPPVKDGFGVQSYNNTFVVWQQDEPNPSEYYSDLPNEVAHFVWDNNVFHAPRGEPPVVADLTWGESLFTPKYKGLRWELEPFDPSFGTPEFFDATEFGGVAQQPTAALAYPTVGGAADGTASGKRAIDDMLYRTRPANACRGALETA